MIVAVIAVRVVKMAGDPIVHMVAVWHGIVAASGPVDMTRVVPTAAMVGGAAVGVLAGHLDHMLVDMTFVRVVEVTIVQVIGVAAVTHGWVATARAVLMRMVGMGGGGARRHGIASFPYSKCTDAAAQRLRRRLIILTVGKSGPEWQGRTAWACWAL